MARPIWNGVISFGLLNVPVSLMSGERKVDLHFRMLDARDKTPIRYERVNADTGQEVPWKEIVKAFEYKKGSYVVLEDEDIEAASPESHESVDIEAFVEQDAIQPAYFEKPYILVPGKKADKGYVLLRETLRKTSRIGIGRVVIRTREYLCALMPQDDVLVLNLLRYPQEVVDPADFQLPGAKPASARLTKAELDMAEKLVESMSAAWKPEDYHDEYRERLGKVIEKRMKSKGVTRKIEDEADLPEDASTNVVDFMSLLRKSLATNKRTPARSKSAPAAKKKTAAKAKSRSSKSKSRSSSKSTRKRA